MRFKEWLDILSETPIITLAGPDGKSITQNVSVRICSPGQPSQRAQMIPVSRIDLRYEDYGLFKDKPTPLKKNFAAPLADGRYINVTLDSGLGGNGVIDTKKHTAPDKSTQQFVPYEEIRPDWACFAQFVNHDQVTRHAPGDQFRGDNRAAV